MLRNDLSRSLVAFDQNSTLVAVVELSLNRWVGSRPCAGLSKQPLKALGPDASALLALVNRCSWKERKAETGSKRLWWPLKLVVTASGLRGGCGHEE